MYVDIWLQIFQLLSTRSFRVKWFYRAGNDQWLVSLFKGLKRKYNKTMQQMFWDDKSFSLKFDKSVCCSRLIRISSATPIWNLLRSLLGKITKRHNFLHTIRYIFYSDGCNVLKICLKKAKYKIEQTLNHNNTNKKRVF